ncbi:MAG: hypothetical protein KGM49_12425, partial [Sphingomonadales bacterium]|nr:hypothetical protein [Sphingomonadales bacterium]
MSREPTPTARAARHCQQIGRRSPNRATHPPRPPIRLDRYASRRTARTAHVVIDPHDSRRLAEALTLAASAIGVSDPNPRVGCVIGDADGRVLGGGATQAAGQAHAEVMALRDAQAA